MAVVLFDRIGGADHARGSSRVVAPRAIRATIASMVLIPYLAGCFQYVPADPGAVPVGAAVALEIDERGRTELMDVIGPGAERIEGQVLTNSDSELVLSVSSVRHVDLREPVRWAGERVAIPRELVTNVEQRTVDRTRSWIAGGLAVIGAVFVSNIAIRALGEDVEQPQPPGPGNGEDQ